MQMVVEVGDEHLARAGDRRTVVSAGRANQAARTLYERAGFTPAGEREVIPRLWITSYAHRPTPR